LLFFRDRLLLVLDCHKELLSDHYSLRDLLLFLLDSIPVPKLKIYYSWHVHHFFRIFVVCPVNTVPLVRTVNFLFFLFFVV